MSFIFEDKSLLSKLIALAQQNPDAANIQEIAKKFVGNLLAETDTSSEFTADKDNAELHMQLRSLKELLYFLSNNGIKLGNTYLVLPHAANNPMAAGSEGDAKYTTLSPAEKAAYFKYPDQDDFQYYVNKDALIKYLQHLQEEANKDVSEKGKFLGAMLKNLLKEVDSELGLQMPVKDNSLPQTQILDNLPNDLDFKSPYSTGSNDLTIKDMLSKGALYSFLESKNIGFTKDSNKKPKDFEPADLCSIVQILHSRAERFRGLKGENPVNTKYLELIKNISESIPNCSLENSTSNSNQSANYQTAAYITSDGKLTPEGIKQMSSVEWPLMPEDIDFERINRFATKYKEITKDAAGADEVLKLLQNLKQGYPSITVQELTTTNYTEIAKIVAQATNNKETTAVQYLTLLFHLLERTQQILARLLAIFRRSEGPAITAIVSDLNEQVHNTYEKNIYEIRNFQGQMQQVYDRIKK